MTFLLYIFGNAITAIVVTAALIIFNPANREKRAEAKLRREEDLFNMILEAAKRIDDERKPNPEFTPPPTKRKHDYFMQDETDGVVRRWANRGAAFPKDITVCGKQYMLWSINAEPDVDVAEYREIKTPTTGSSAIRPKERKYDELDAVAKFNEACHELGNAGGSTTDEIVEKIIVIGEVNAVSTKEIADALDRINKKPVTPERLKEAGFAVAPVHSCASMDYRANPMPNLHSTAKKTQPTQPTNGVVDLKLQIYPRSTSDELKAAIEAVDREQKENLAALRKPERECRKCKYFDDSGGKFGLCIKNEEIVDGDSVKECWTGKTTPVKAKAKPISRPAPLGTVPERRKP